MEGVVYAIGDDGLADATARPGWCVYVREHPQVERPIVDELLRSHVHSPVVCMEDEVRVVSHSKE
jgi:hypothetical protein